MAPRALWCCSRRGRMARRRRRLMPLLRARLLKLLPARRGLRPCAPPLAQPRLGPLPLGSLSLAPCSAYPHGTRFASFAPPRPEVSWSGIIKSEDSPYYTHQVLSNRQHFVGSTSTYSKEGRRFPFLQEGDQISFSTSATLEISVCQPLLKTVAPPPESSSSNKIFSDGLTQVLDSDCALSLLSSPANSSSVEVSRMVQPTEHIPMAQSLVPNLQFGSSSWFACSQASSGVSTAGFTCPSMDSGHLNTVLVPSSNGNEMNYHGIFHVGAEASSDGTSPSLPFSWQ